MKRITYKDFQLDKEIELESKIAVILEEKPIDDTENVKFDYGREKIFYEWLKSAIEIENHFSVDTLKRIIREQLDVEKLDFRIFLYQSVDFKINCYTRDVGGEQNLMIFVSQHFFNILNEEEQLGILGHEVAHHLFNHQRFPSHSLINSHFDIGDIKSLKEYLIYHSKIKEISSDFVGLACCNFNYKAYSSALIKYTTGLSDSANSVFSISPLVDMVLDQYEKHLKNPFFFDLYSTHPLMPVRVRIIKSLINTPLVRNYQFEVAEKNYNSYKKEFNNAVEAIIKQTYPEMFPTENKINSVLAPMSIAVMLADGEIDEKELLHIREKAKESGYDNSSLLDRYSTNLSAQNIKKEMNKLIKEAIHTANEEAFNKILIIPIIRSLILVAASDGDIHREELKVIYKFAKGLKCVDFTKQDIVLIMKTQYKL